MDRNEALSKGVEVCATTPSMKRRSRWHDYRLRGTYMLTLVVNGRRPLLGTLRGTRAGTTGAVRAWVELSALGEAIVSEEMAKISRFYPQVEVWKVCVMPDHLHLIVRVKEDLPDGKHLGAVVRGFKTGCSRAWWRLGPLAWLPGRPSGEAEGTVTAPLTALKAGRPSAALPSTASVPSAFPEGEQELLFEAGYNDKILLREGQLDNWKAYLDDNPRRLFLKRERPDLFTVIHGMTVAGRPCQVVGNRFLLDIPDKMAVIVHRRYTATERARLREEWLACGERGGVLVSAAIAPAEKEVLREAMNRGYSIILLRENGFSRFYKPSGESFDACSEGLLLQVSPWEHHTEQRTITRAQCLELNALAERIADEV